MKQLARSASVTGAMENALQEGHCVRNRWQVIKKIGQGAFGEVYQCKDRKDGCQVAIKIFSKEKDSTTANQLLKLEVSVLKALQGENFFPKFLAFGKTMRFDYLAMELLGPSLSELRRRQPDRKFSLSTTLRLGEMMLKCIQSLHRTGFVHRDIKPSNFVMGLGKNARKVFLLDFGLSRQILLENGEMRPARPKASFQGTPRYASINVLNHIEAGRHDDLISLFYVLSEFAFQELPWKNLRELRDVAEAKEMYDHHVMIKEFPDGFQDYFDHVKDMKYCDVPNYELLYSVFDQCIKRRGVKETDPFDFESGDLEPFVELQKKGGSLSAQSQKTQSDVLIVKCSSIDKPEIMEEKLQNTKPLNGLIQNLGESNMTEDICKMNEWNSAEKLNINSKNIYSACKDTIFITPPSVDSQLQNVASTTPNLESEVQNDQNITPTTQPTVEPKNVCPSNSNEGMLVNSILTDNVPFEQEKSKYADNIQLQDKNVCENIFKTCEIVANLSSLAVPMEKLWLKVDKSIGEKHTLLVRRSVPNVLKESDKLQKQELLRCWSCPTISYFIQSDLKPPLKQQSSFEVNVNKLQDVAITKKGEATRIDYRRNSLPITLTCPTIHNIVSELKNNSTLDISLQRHSVNKSSKYNNKDSINNIPNTSRSLNLNSSLVSESENDVKKSLSDSNISLRKSKSTQKDNIGSSKIMSIQRMPEITPNHQDICKQEKEIKVISRSELNTPKYSLRKSAPCIFENVHCLVNEKDCQEKLAIADEFSIGDNDMKNTSKACNNADTSSKQNECASPQISTKYETNINTDSRIKSSFSNENDDHSLVIEPTNLNATAVFTNTSVCVNGSFDSSHKLSKSLSENNISQSTKNVTPRKESSSEETSSLNFKNCYKTNENFQNNGCITAQESKSFMEIANPSQDDEDLSPTSLKNNHPQIDIPEIVINPAISEDKTSGSESINKNSRRLSTNEIQSIGHEEQENVLTSGDFLLDSKTSNDTDNSLQNNEVISLHSSESDKNNINPTNLIESIPPNVNDSSNSLLKECIDLNLPVIVINTAGTESNNEPMKEISEHLSENEMQCPEKEISKKVLPSGQPILLDSETCNETETCQNNEPASQKMSESCNKSGNSDYSDDGSFENHPLPSLTDKNPQTIVPDTGVTECGNSISQPVNKLFKSKSESVMPSTDNMTAQYRRRQRGNSDDKYVKNEKELNLNFTRRRQRPTSQIYEEPAPEYESHSQMPAFSSALLDHKTEASQNVSSELLNPPSDEPPPNHCLPSRRVRYRRAL